MFLEAGSSGCGSCSRIVANVYTWTELTGCYGCPPENSGGRDRKKDQEKMREKKRATTLHVECNVYTVALRASRRPVFCSAGLTTSGSHSLDSSVTCLEAQGSMARDRFCRRAKGRSHIHHSVWQTSVAAECPWESLMPCFYP